MDTDDSKGIESVDDASEMKESDESQSISPSQGSTVNISAEERQRIPIYFTLTEERRSRFHLILQNRDKLKFKLSRRVKLQYTLNGQTRFCIESTMLHCKPFKKEPTVWYLETLMPGQPEDVLDHWGSSHHRFKWDKRVKHHEKRPLFRDQNCALHLVYNQSEPVLGGAISPRQFTSIVKTWKLADGLELASKSISHPDFPSKKGLVDGVNVLYGHRIRTVHPQELKDVYKIPQILVTNGNDENVQAMPWVKCQYVLQTDIKGWVPKKVVDGAISGGSMDTFDLCRNYILKEICGFQTAVKRVGFKLGGI